MTGHAFLPNVCGIPSFDDLSHTQIVSLTMKALVGDVSPQLATGPDRQRFLNLIRLTDRTIMDFGLARGALQKYIDLRHQGNLSSLFTAVSHVEAGMTALARCLVFADALKKSATAPPVTHNELPRDHIRTVIRELRNEIEHHDKAIARGDIPAEMMPMLHIRDDRVELLPFAITWSELDGAVRKVHSLTARLIEL